MLAKFKLLNRGFKKTMVFLPGWATDYRIFNTLELNYNYLLPVEYYPFNFQEELKNFLGRQSLDKVSLFGWSMGGFLASDFALKNPKKVDRLILLSLQKKYSPDLLKEIKMRLKKNKEAFLYKLYLNSFSKEDKESLNWFKDNLLKTYIEEFKLEDLLGSLDYLFGAKINPVSLAGIEKITIFHGQEDKIAPIQGALEMKPEFPQAEFICLTGIGHIPFLSRKFKERFLNE